MPCSRAATAVIVFILAPIIYLMVCVALGLDMAGAGALAVLTAFGCWLIVPLDLAVTVPSREQSTAQAAEDRRGSTAAMDNRDELPSTASSLPWIGAAGLALLAFAGALTLARALRPVS